MESESEGRDEDYDDINDPQDFYNNEDDDG